MDVEVDTVYGASRYEQKVTAAPSSVTIVTAAEIRNYGYRTLADLLKSVRGFYVTYDRNYSYVGVRGFGRPGDYNSRILLQIDGHRVNDNVYNGCFVGEEFILDVDLIDRVEIIRGPSSSIYGNSAFFGVINVITRKGRDLGGAEVSASAASLDTYKGRLSYGNIFPNGLEMVVSGSGLYSEGNDTLFYKEYASPVTNNGFSHNSDYENGFKVFTNLSFHDFNLQGAYNSREKGIPTGSFNTDFNDPRNRTDDKYGYADLRYEKSFTNGLALVARLYYDNDRYQGDYIYSNISNNVPYSGVVNNDSDRSDWWGGELLIKKTFLEKHTIILGTEYVDNIHQDQLNYNEQPYTLYLDDRRSSQNWALYGQGEFAVNDAVTLNLGVRWDYFEFFGGTVNPRLAAIYKPISGTILKLLYGTAFRAPSAYELYYNDGGLSSEASTGLKPEKISTYEADYEQYFGEHLNSTVAYYHYDIDNLISQTVDPANSLLVYRNIDKVRTDGVEVELSGKWGNGLEARGSYCYQNAVDVTTNQPLTNSPRHLVKANVIIPLLPEKIFSGIELQYTSKRKTLQNNEDQDFIVTNVTLFGKNLLKGLEFSGSIYNLFDKKYGDPGGAELRQDVIEQDGRTFRIKLTYKF
jgi:iron complex outermembrane receptor protein